jgi:predicted ribonuclease YlaK
MPTQANNTKLWLLLSSNTSVQGKYNEVVARLNNTAAELESKKAALLLEKADAVREAQLSADLAKNAKDNISFGDNLTASQIAAQVLNALRYFKQQSNRVIEVTKDFDARIAAANEELVAYQAELAELLG